MTPNLGHPDRVVRAVLGAAALGGGLVGGGLSLWGLALDAAGALLLLSAATGFCHVYKTLGLETGRGSRAGRG
jgi:hypothetical protein